MEEKLKEIFSLVNNWLKFAEAKNAGLIVFNGGAIFAVISILKDFKDFNIMVCMTLLLFGSINLISLMIALTAMISVVENNNLSKKKIDKNDNLLFFGHIAKYNEADYTNAIGLRYNLISSSQVLEKDLANQIIVNSQIALRKFNHFNLAVKWTFASFIAPVCIYLLIIFANLFCCCCC